MPRGPSESRDPGLRDALPPCTTESPEGRLARGGWPAPGRAGNGGCPRPRPEGLPRPSNLLLDHPMAALRKGGKLGKYQLEKRLGTGGFAEVWRAMDTVERRRVALKIAFSVAVESSARARLEHEARVLVRLRHPHIQDTRNADWIDGRFVIVSELANNNLYRYGKARRSARVALEVVRQVASALAYAHSQRVMHRDVKPENVLIFPDGRAVLADFGLSRFAKTLGRTYTEAGTLGYMAPEQAYGRPIYASDIFSLGVIAYELLTGVLLRWPFEWPAKGYEKFRAKVPEPLQPVLRKAVEFQPRKRYPDGESLLRAFERAQRKAEEMAAPRKPQRRKRKREVRSARMVEAEHFRKLHGKRLELWYKCHRCSGPISETMTHCPWCGASDHSFRELTRYPLVCPWCERGVKAEWSYCPWCFEGRFESNGKKPKWDPKAERTCSRRGCEGQLRPYMRYCPVCNQKVKRPWTDAELTERCPRCRWPTSRESWRFCPWCGRREAKAGRFGR